jgi:hypothetical protein
MLYKFKNQTNLDYQYYLTEFRKKGLFNFSFAELN